MLALGQAIVEQLKLDRRGDVIDRWLAHHLAELMEQADRGPEPGRREAQDRAVETIIKLWSHRRALPEVVDPLGGLREAIDVLGRMSPQADPWQGSRDYRYEPILSDLFQTLTRTVMAGLLLTLKARMRSLSSPEIALLEDDERRVIDELARWSAYIRKDFGRPRVNVKIVATSSSQGEEEASEGVVGDIEDQEASPSADEADPVNEAALHSIVLDNLEAAGNDLRKLIERWKANAPRNAGEEEEGDW